jgi:hypothetical protein
MHSIFNEKFIVKAAPFEVKSFLFKKKEKKKEKKNQSPLSLPLNDCPT